MNLYLHCPLKRRVICQLYLDWTNPPHPTTMLFLRCLVCPVMEIPAVFPPCLDWKMMRMDYPLCRAVMMRALEISLLCHHFLKKI
jgi:hypothetical protein